MHCMVNRYTIIVSKHYFTYFHKGFLQKKQVRDDEVCVSAGGEFSGVGGGHALSNADCKPNFECDEHNEALNIKT